MRLSEEEKQRLKLEELDKKARGFALKLMDPSGSNTSALSDLEQESAEDKPKLELLVWKNIILGISNQDDIKVFFERFHDWPFLSSKRQIVEEYRSKFKDQLKNSNKDNKSILEREKKKLVEAGISGSAVVPKFSKNAGSAEISNLIEEFKKSLS